MENRNKIFGLIGLAARARKVASGGFMVERSVKSGRSHMVLLSVEASDNTKKKFTNMCTHIKFRSINLEPRTNWGMPWGRKCAPVCPWRMRGSQRR